MYIYIHICISYVVIQVLLPKSGAGETNRDGRAFGCQATLSGLLIHHSLVLHLTDDFVPGNGSPGNGSQLGEVLDVTKTEDKQAQLLLFTAKMAVLLHLAQHPHGNPLVLCPTKPILMKLYLVAT